MAPWDENLPNARCRYTDSFRSSIFEPPPQNSKAEVGPGPAGRRRDQTSAELWGNYCDKDSLRAMPKTFVPRDNGATAYQKKMDNLSSHITGNANGNVAAGFGPLRTESHYRHVPAFPDMDSDEVVNTSLRRQMELKSHLFGRSTPSAAASQTGTGAGAGGERLTPNDMHWHDGGNHHDQSRTADLSTHERSYHEKCSNVLNYHSPPEEVEARRSAEQRAKQEEDEADAKRRENAHYSDLFGRRAPPSEAGGSYAGGERRAKPRASAEDRLIIQSDWADARTEVRDGQGQARPEAPALRKREELYQARIFGSDSGAPRRGWEETPSRLEPFDEDTSSKTRSMVGRSTQEIHQAHLRSSVASDSWYDEARSTTQWEVAELMISGLGSEADDDYVRKLCHGQDLHIVQAVADVDPVRNLCKGRAKVRVRYNPDRQSLDGLIQQLRNSRLHVAI
mmetsp:Transcript_38140/g.80790  ORF Transcript_38140/g.80790 Transcript_38140/m.80790 type:complete len:451 (+) Transcript_38140:136-1488(+)|eukprot:CAMPEP_0206445000 /NCGR_PEP_ID=MMETSP0324_2-20121206/15235_1 /ASSEMBLY_ACC=CAM_ASM_000836 /TAXON_ID=2866 /ORGANISM="Crypthecodinium cohnii, Strain Seligo" /LENGTH=450 /DNA_ID=CAMNT_0053913107 /DNA_START=112 /DNA_END=1464 /DNA_ORIENTATION=+